jgi:3-deoxy-D-manno-octulosonic-acid transferase
MWWLYQGLFALLLLVAGPFLLLARGRHYLPTLAGRFALRAPCGVLPGGLWIHAVSVGEVAVAATLARALPPGERLIVTTITPTGQERARRTLGERAAVGYLPFDLGPAVESFFRATAPRALFLVEGDYWPLVLRAAKRRGLPVAVVNGRISDRAFPRLRALRPLVRRLLLARVDRFGVQSAVDRERLLALGVEEERIAVTGNLKFEAPAPPPHPELEDWIARLAAGRPVLLAGSTMAGEERLLLDAFARAGGPASALLLLAPRHPERFDAVAQEIERRFPGSARRSAATKGAPPVPPPVALLDTLGELAAAYRGARAAFVGGTLVPSGGHNPLEPARFGVPVAVGPSMTNFQEIAASFDRARAWARVADERELAGVWHRWLLDAAAAAEVGRRGQELVESHRGALERTLAWLAPLLAPPERNGEPA